MTVNCLGLACILKSLQYCSFKYFQLCVQTSPSSVDLDQMPQNAGLCCLPLIQQYSDTKRGSKMASFAISMLMGLTSY